MVETHQFTRAKEKSSRDYVNVTLSIRPPNTSRIAIHAACVDRGTHRTNK